LFFSSSRRHTRFSRDWSSDVCSSDLTSTVVNMRDVVSSVSRTRPWLFPFRLSKVTAGAVSTALIVLLTAESWELANAQAPLRGRSEEHTSELQSREKLVCRLLHEQKY